MILFQKSWAHFLDNSFFKEISTINKGIYFSLILLTNYYQHYSTLWSLVKFFFTAQIVYRFDEILMEFKHYFRTSITIMIWIWMETNDSNSVKMKLNHHTHSEAEYYTTTLFFDEEKKNYSLVSKIWSNTENLKKSPYLQIL